jgi:hypothetical protein
MPIDSVSSTTLVFPLFNFALRAFQTGCELSSAQTNAKDLLETISQVASDIKSAKEFRRRKAYFLDDNEIAKFDKAIKNAETAMAGLEELVEPARVDMAVNYGQVKARSRIMWIMRDSNKVGAALGRLTIASVGLQSQMIMMTNKTRTDDGDENHHKNHHRRNDDDQGSPPPSYLQATLDAMHERRKSFKRARPTSTPPILPDAQPIEPPASTAATDSGLSASINNVADFIRYNEEVFATLSSVPNSSPRNELVPAVLISSLNRASSLDSICEMGGSHSLAVESQRPLSESAGAQSTSADVPPPPVPAPRNQLRYANRPLTNGYSPDQTPSRIPTILRPGSRPYALSTPSIPAPATAVYSSAPVISNSSQPQTVVSSSPSADMQNVPRSLVLPQRQNPRSTSTSAIMESETFIPGHRNPMLLRWHEPVDDDDDDDDDGPQSRAGTATGLERPSGVLPSGRATASTDPATAQTQTNGRPVRNLRRRNTYRTGIHQGQKSTDNSTTRNRRPRLEWQVTQQLNEVGDVMGNGDI